MHELLEEKTHLPITWKDSIKQVCKRKNLALYTTEAAIMNTYLICKIIYIEIGRIDSLAMALTKGNSYTDLMNYYLRQFQLNGVMHKLDKKDKHILSKNNASKSDYNVVGLGNVALTLTILADGMTLALFILIIERKYYSFNTLFS